MSNMDFSEERMARYQTVSATKGPAVTAPFGTKKRLQTVLHTGLVAAAFVFVAAVVLGLFP